MFLQASVILFTGGVPALGSVCSWAVSAPGGCLLPGGYLLQRSACSGGGGVWWSHPAGTATAAGDTHSLECILVRWIFCCYEIFTS